MGSATDFLGNMDWWGLLTLLVSAASALFCITIHELSHGLAAYRLGDPTAKNAGATGPRHRISGSRRTIRRPHATRPPQWRH